MIQSAQTADFTSRLAQASQSARRELLRARIAQGHWLGELSSSALSTATAVTALTLFDRAQAGRSNAAGPDSQTLKNLVKAGLAWLARHANADGGWGDTTRSLSNISTTALCWAAFGAAPNACLPQTHAAAHAEAWLINQAGGIDRETISKAIIRRYGKDRTFSVPILTMCALAGRLGSGPEAWKPVIPLPFELAACPHSWYAALRLPVVSYALPALIAIGHARHHHLPSRNPLVRWIRNRVKRRTLRILQAIQPASGGFLEATPLTSFVVMSLAGSGLADFSVTLKGIEFLVQSARADGSWPIDTNLATWVTTLAVNALADPEARHGPMPERLKGPKADATDSLSKEDRTRLWQWLLSQQYRSVHPYTQAPPGGWAWTDLPGGVPDADDTAGALLAIHHLGIQDEQTIRSAHAGLTWLLNLQNRDGGIPTFCRGWGALPFDRSSPDLTAHAIRAWRAWQETVPEALGERLRTALRRAVHYLRATQRADGSWLPLWFGNQHASDDENPCYGTARVLVALCDKFILEQPKSSTLLQKGVEWMIAAQHESGAFGGVRHGPASVEETALAVEALATALSEAPSGWPAELKLRIETATLKGAQWLVERIENGDWKEAAPIGFYFAKLWYFERLYPQIFAAGAMRSCGKWLKGRPPNFPRDWAAKKD